MEILLVDKAERPDYTLARYFGHRGFEVIVTRDNETAVGIATMRQPGHILIDLDIPDSMWLPLVAQLKAVSKKSKLVVLTSYASIATAVEAIRLGAIDYLPKPIKADEVFAAFEHGGDGARPSPAPRPMSVDRLVWEHINRVFMKQGRNVSATARALSMHRRTLQRMLQKHAVKD